VFILNMARTRLGKASTLRGASSRFATSIRVVLLLLTVPMAEGKTQLSNRQRQSRRPMPAGQAMPLNPGRLRPEPCRNFPTPAAETIPNNLRPARGTRAAFSCLSNQNHSLSPPWGAQQPFQFPARGKYAQETVVSEQPEFSRFGVVVPS